MANSEETVGVFLEDGWVGVDVADTTVLFTPDQAKELAYVLRQLADEAELFNKPRN